MSRPVPIDQEHQRKYEQAIREARLSGPQAFQSWFNRADTINQAVVQGYWDFAIQILTPIVLQYLPRPEVRTALEIGYGGGRLLNAACSFFSHVTGVDIHQEEEEVRSFLKAQGKENFTLLQTTGRSIPVESESVDFIYSFIVFQHLQGFTVFQNYISECFRCLKTGGVAQIFFGNFSKLHPVNRLRYYLRGYQEIPDAKVNFTSLVVRTAKAKQIASLAGFRVLGSGSSYKFFPQTFSVKKGGQNFITLLKSISGSGA